MLLQLIVLTFVRFVSSIRNGSVEDKYVPDYSDRYFYRHLKEKMIESMSVNECSISGPSWSIGSPSDKPDLVVREIEPDDIVRKHWGSVYDERNVKTRIFTQVSKNLCKNKRFRFFKRRGSLLSKGCLDMFERRGNVTSKVIKRYGATLHPNHIRCDLEIANMVCSKGTTGPFLIHSSYRRYHNYPFLVNVTGGVVVARSGMLALPCGPFGLFSSCEAVNMALPKAVEALNASRICRKALQLGHHHLIRKARSYIKDHDSLCPLQTYKKIFMASQYDDTQIGQFMLESLPKLVYHLDYLLRNPDVMIHFGFTKRPTVPHFTLPNLFFGWFGLNNRLLNGTFFAEEEALMPREGGCQDASYNAWEILHQRETLLHLAMADDRPSRSAQLRIRNHPSYALIKSKFVDRYEPMDGKPVVLLIERNPASRFIQNKGDWAYRMWPNYSAPFLRAEFSRKFPRHEFRVYSDINGSLLSCPPCQVRLFHRADVVIGVHGAGMANIVYMKPGGVVVEALPYFDARHAPVTGIFPRVSSVIGLHHYLYYYQDSVFDPQNLVDETVKFFNKVKMWS